MKNLSHPTPLQPISRHPFAGMLTTLVATLAIILSGCSRSNEEQILELLSTVPADAELVGVFNLNTLVDQTGGKVKDQRIEDASQLSALIKDFCKDLGMDEPGVALLLSPGSGIEAGSAVAFTYKGVPYLSATIGNEADLTAAIDKICPGDWESAGKMKHKDDYVIRQDRLWISRAGTANIDKFANLSEVESFRSNDYAATLSAAPDAISIWGSIDNILKSAELSFSQQTTTRLALGMCFSSPRSIALSANIEKDYLKSTLRVLDANLKPAKCELALSKIDTSLVSGLGGNANFVMAAAVSQKLVKQLMDLTSSFGGAMPQAYSSALEPIDGTIAFAATLDPKNFTGFTGLGFKGAIQTSGKNNAALLQVLESMVGKVSIDGSTFNFGNEGYGSGIAPLADVAKDFDGAWIGVAGATMLSDRPPYHYFVITLRQADNSLILNFSIHLK